MRVKIVNRDINLNILNNISYKISCIARDAMEYVKCGNKNAICGTFSCSQEIPISSIEGKGGDNVGI